MHSLGGRVSDKRRAALFTEGSGLKRTKVFGDGEGRVCEHAHS